MRCAAAHAPHAKGDAEGEISVAVRRVDRRPEEGGPVMQPLRRMGLAGSYRRLATARMEVLEVSFEVLSGMIGGPS